MRITTAGEDGFHWSRHVRETTEIHEVNHHCNQQNKQNARKQVAQENREHRLTGLTIQPLRGVLPQNELFLIPAVADARQRLRPLATNKASDCRVLHTFAQLIAAGQAEPVCKCFPMSEHYSYKKNLRFDLTASLR
jgi:hypothetical protein